MDSRAGPRRQCRRGAKTAPTKRRADQAIAEALRGFLQHIGSLTILDPARGSGNFLYVAIQQLLDLEKQVITYAARPDIAIGLLPTVRPTQVHGIEINAYAAVDPEGGWREDWAEVWQDSGAGQPLPDGHPLAQRRAEVDGRVLGDLLRLNLARAASRDGSQ